RWPKSWRQRRSWANGDQRRVEPLRDFSVLDPEHSGNRNSHATKRSASICWKVVDAFDQHNSLGLAAHAIHFLQVHSTPAVDHALGETPERITTVLEWLRRITSKHKVLCHVRHQFFEVLRTPRAKPSLDDLDRLLLLLVVAGRRFCRHLRHCLVTKAGDDYSA